VLHFGKRVGTRTSHNRCRVPLPSRFRMQFHADLTGRRSARGGTSTGDRPGRRTGARGFDIGGDGSDGARSSETSPGRRRPTVKDATSHPQRPNLARESIRGWPRSFRDSRSNGKSSFTTNSGRYRKRKKTILPTCIKKLTKSKN